MQNQIPKNWQSDTLSNLADIILGGTPSRSDPNYWNGDIKWISIVDIVGSEGRFIKTASENITREGLGHSAAKLLPKDTIVLSSRGTVGEMGLLSEPMAFNQSCYGLISKDQDKFDQIFLYYKLKEEIGKLKKLAHGGVFDTFTKSTFDQINILYPENVNIQKQIASVLSTFDDKIEINNNIAKTLEEMAQLLFKEWFIKPQYPTGKLSDIAKITMGQSPPSKFYNQKSEGLPFHQGVTNFGGRFPIHEIYCRQNNRVAEKGDILFSVRAPVGRLNLADTRISLGRGVAALRHKNNHQSYLCYLLKRLFKKEDSLGGGSVFPSVTKDDMESMKIIVPDQKIIEKFEEIVSNMDKKIELVERENQKLAALRDLFLPKLMKGEIVI